MSEFFQLIARPMLLLASGVVSKPLCACTQGTLSA